MTPHRYRRVGDLFEAALERPLSDRSRFLDNACGGDAQLRKEVQGLLDHNLESDTFLQPLTERAARKMPLPDRIGAYFIRRILGEGGMGAVYLAEQPALCGREVALKVIRPGMGSQSVIARFEAERRILAMMTHPNIACVSDAGTDGALPYFVMEFVPGLPIGVYCEKHQLSIRERTKLFVPVCEAIQYAHERGVIHRDIKPSNVLVSDVTGHPVPKVIDFGLAKALDETFTDEAILTKAGTLLGTLQYMSPEQADLVRRRDLDARADVYSLGALFYEVLTGHAPIETDPRRESYLSQLPRIREEQPRPPGAWIGPSFDRELNWIILKALAKKRDDRYPSVKAMIRDLNHHLTGSFNQFTIQRRSDPSDAR